MLIELQGRVNHHQWRCIVRRERRRRIRQARARKRDKKHQEELEALLLDPVYVAELEEYQRLEEISQKLEEEEAARRKEEWELRDAALHSKFLREKEKRRLQEEAQRKQEELIKKEWEEKQKKEKEEEERKKEEQVWIKLQGKLYNQILGYIHPHRMLFSKLLPKALARCIKCIFEKEGDESTHNPEPPANYPSRDVVCAEREPCPFFTKTGACRFGIHCSREHAYPDISDVILIPNMYSHFGLEKVAFDEYDDDASLEYSEHETLDHFRDFYNDTLPEFRKYGSLMQFKVCCNASAHLRGNVYVQYSSEAEAARVYTIFNGRWYAGRQLSCVFVALSKWKSALCRLFQRNRKGCPKGGQCNFLHAFRNPGNAFWQADQDLPPSGPYLPSSSKLSQRSPNQERGKNRSKSKDESVRSRSRSRSRSKRSRRSRSRSGSRSSYSSSKRSRSSSRSRRSHNNSKRSRSQSRSSGKKDHQLNSTSNVGKSENSSSKLKSNSRSRKISRRKRGSRSNSDSPNTLDRPEKNGKSPERHESPRNKGTFSNRRSESKSGVLHKVKK